MKRTTTIVALVASAVDWQQFRKDESNIGWTNYAPNTSLWLPLGRCHKALTILYLKKSIKSFTQIDVTKMKSAKIKNEICKDKMWTNQTTVQTIRDARESACYFAVWYCGKCIKTRGGQ
jgi:hypothetical protein